VKKPTNKKRWQLLAGLAISLAALALAFLKIDLRQVGQSLAQADYLYLLPALLFTLLYLLARSVRWRLLLGPQVSLARCFWVTTVGYLVSNVLPFRLGDPARAVVIGRGGRVSTAAALSTVVVERVLDMLMVVLLLAGVAPFVGRQGGEGAVSDTVRLAGWGAAAAALAALAVLFLFAFRPQWGRRMVRWALGKVPHLDAERWARTFDGLFDGLAPLRSGRRGLALLAWSLVTWALVVLYYWAMLRAFLPQPPLLAAPFLVCLLGLGMAVPSSPGAMGVFHSIARYGLQVPFAIAAEPALAIAFAAHAFQYLFVCALGLVGMARESLSLGWLQTRVADVEEGE